MDKTLISFQYNKTNVVPINVYALSVPLIILGTMINDINLLDIINVINWFTIAVLSLLVCYVFALVAKHLFFNKIFVDKIPVSVVLLYGIILGFLKGSSTFYLAVWLGVYTPGDLNPQGITRMAAATFLGVWFAMTSPIILTFFNNYKNAPQELIRLGAKVEQDNYQTEIKIDNMQKKFQKEFGNELTQIIESSKPYLNEDPNFSKQHINLLIQKIRNVIDITVRPTSHRLWLEGHLVHPGLDLNLKKMITSAMHLKPFPKIFVILIYFISAVFRLYGALGNIGIIVAMLNSLTIYVIYSLASTYFRNKRLSFPKFLGIVLVTSLVINIVNNLIFLQNNFVSIFFSALLGFVWLTYLTLAVAVIYTTKMERDLVLKEIEKIIDAKSSENIELKEYESMINIQLSKFIHGQVQNKLVSAALNLEKAAKENNSSQVNNLISEISRDIEDSFGMITAMSSEKNLSDFLIDLRNGWKGICEISFEVEQSLQNKKSDLYVRASEAIAEAVSNSVHHGKAEKVHINAMRLDDNLAQIEVSDNGKGIESSFAGLGSKIFDNLAGDNWSLQENKNGEGVKLKLTFFCPTNI
jgi:signal transduction histidine kinase